MDIEQKRIQLGENIARIRREQNLSQARLGEMAGISRYHVYLIERGKISFGVDKLFALSEALGVSPSEMLKDF